MRIADCGLRTADCGLWIADCGKDRVPRVQLYFDLNFNINFCFFMSKYVFRTQYGVSIINFFNKLLISNTKYMDFNVHAFDTANCNHENSLSHRQWIC